MLYTAISIGSLFVRNIRELFLIRSLDRLQPDWPIVESEFKERMLMSRLSNHPTGRVETIAQVEAVAAGLAAHAKALYRGLAERMAAYGNEAASAAFAKIEEIQAGVQASHPAQSISGMIVYEDEGAMDRRLVSPYAAYSLAVRNEERAFTFWTYLSAHASDPRVRSEAERLALEQMDKVRALRSARRRAYHGGGEGRRREDLHNLTPEELRRQAAEREGAMADLHSRIASDLARLNHPTRDIVAAIARDESEAAAALGGSPQASSTLHQLPEQASALLDLAVEQLEVSVELYLTASELSQDEDVVTVAQRFADQAIERIARLR